MWVAKNNCPSLGNQKSTTTNGKEKRNSKLRGGTLGGARGSVRRPVYKSRRIQKGTGYPDSIGGGGRCEAVKRKKGD